MISFEFMHMVDGLLRSASVSRIVQVIDNTNLKKRNNININNNNNNNNERRTIIENDDLYLTGRFATVAFEKPDTYSRLQSPVSITDDDDGDGEPIVPVSLTVERGSTLYSGS